MTEHYSIIVARKPLSEKTIALNVMKWGTGGINIDESRIGYSADDHVMKYDGYKNGEYKSEYTEGTSYTHGNQVQINPQGRFPANIIFDEEAGKILDEQSGIQKSTKWKKKHNDSVGGVFGGGNMHEGNSYGDTGGASRFFYCPKASKKDRNEGCDELNEKQRPGQTDKGNYSASPVCIDCGKTVNGTNDHSNCKEGLEYRPSTTTTKNHHPTVKPTDLMAYLIRLVTPKGGTVLDPFMGSGSTGKAAVREGMDFIGIEREDEYMEIAKSRIEHEQGKHKHRQFFE
jgi:site-specific DNA-methyltransferase (adenine-specific)